MTTIIKFIKKLFGQSKHQDLKIDEKYIVPSARHHVSKTDVSINAVNVLKRLTHAGYQAYLVGGSVRDLLLRKAPKDFDVATNATPNQIRRLFRNARIIGRRFKLVHIIYQREIIEVATFRSFESLDDNQKTNVHGILVRDNAYGTLEEDAWRRDFTINSLYFDIKHATIVDFTGGVDDVHNRLIRIIGNPSVRFQEDPVRMLRALRFCAKLHFTLEEKTQAPLKELAYLITHISGSRLFDEMTKFYQCGESIKSHGFLVEYGLFPHLFPKTHDLMGSEYPVNALIGIALESTDRRILDNKPVTPAFIFAILLWFPVIHEAKQLQIDEALEFSLALERAISQVISEQNRIITIPKRFTQVMREIWLMQFRFEKRTGSKAFHLLEHPRFRAAYDFLALRALAGDESMQLADWWTRFQDVELKEQQKMIQALRKKKKS